MKTALVRKNASLACCLLALAAPAARGQTSSGTQIIGYNNSNDLNDLTDLTSSPYTTFIDGFLSPTSSSTAAAPGLTFDTLGSSTLNSARVTAFNQVENAGKNVLMSFGGQGAASTYAAFATGGTYNGSTYTATQATQTLANILSAYVTGASTYFNVVTNTATAIATYDHSAGTFKGFNGIDLDFEDTQSFQTQNNPTYNGVTFVSQLTIDLRNNLGGGYLITQAPQTPYLDSAYTQNNTGTYGLPSGGYQAILENGYAGSNPTASAAGLATSWLNVQFYNNNGDDGNGSVAGVVQAFKNLVNENPGIPTGKFVLTLPINAENAGDNFFTGPQITQIVHQINQWLISKGDGTIAGVAGFELYNPDLAGNQQQMDDNNLDFAEAVQAGAVPEPATFACLVIGALGLTGWRVRRQRSGAN